METITPKFIESVVYQMTVPKTHPLITGGKEVKEPVLNKSAGDNGIVTWFRSCEFLDDEIPTVECETITSRWSCSKEIADKYYKGIKRGYYELTLKSGNIHVKQVAIKYI